MYLEDFIMSGHLDSFAFKRVALTTCFLELINWKEYVKLQSHAVQDWVKEGPVERFGSKVMQLMFFSPVLRHNEIWWGILANGKQLGLISSLPGYIQQPFVPHSSD